VFEKFVFPFAFTSPISYPFLRQLDLNWRRRRPRRNIRFLNGQKTNAETRVRDILNGCDALILDHQDLLQTGGAEEVIGRVSRDGEEGGARDCHAVYVQLRR
jgi:hypothetical protein